MSSSDTTIDQLIYKRTSKTRGVLLKSSYQNLNKWSHGTVRRIEIQDFYFDMRTVQWKGQTINVEYELFTMLIKQWMTDKNWTKEQALDEFFDMTL